MQELTNKVMNSSETSGLGIACGNLLSRGGVKSATAFHYSLNSKGTPSCAGKKTAMKKLMFAAAVAACATVGLAGESGITSQNIVGYQNSGIKLLSSVGVNSFSPVSGDPVDIQEFKVTVTKGTLSSGQISIQTLTSGGGVDQTYQWIVAEDGEDYGFEPGVAGWYDINAFGPAEGVTFADGVGFMFDNQAPAESGLECHVTYSGEVVDGATDVPVALLTGISGNMTPVKRDIQRFAVVSDTIESGQASIQTVTSGGGTDQTYQWIIAKDAEDYGFEPGVAGWYDINAFGPAESVEFEAGEGFVIDNQSGTEVVLRVPNPLE